MRTACRRMAASLKIVGYRQSTAHQGPEEQRGFVLRISRQKARFLRLRNDFRGRFVELC